MRERTAVLAIDLARHAKLLFDERELLGVILVLLIPRRHDASQRRQMATAALEFGSPDLLEHLPEHLLCGLGVAAVQCAAQAELREYPVVQEIGRAHAELQSLMRISYAVFCLK